MMQIHYEKVWEDEVRGWLFTDWIEGNLETCFFFKGKHSGWQVRYRKEDREIPYFVYLVSLFPESSEMVSWDLSPGVKKWLMECGQMVRLVENPFNYNFEVTGDSDGINRSMANEKW